ncbi:MAG: FliM/FliN family flagellar motor switch protein [Candidatus Brocadiae bacterium]|nr:FliM/FliN family flagellar motor switch protein [Candidatus Brocadiia bacterium]
MTRPLVELLALELPVAVVLAERTMTLGQVLALAPGAVIEFPQAVAGPLDIRLHDRRIAVGNAVRAGDRFGVQVLDVADADGILRPLDPAARG